jgi:hypothetical protein
MVLFEIVDAFASDQLREQADSSNITPLAAAKAKAFLRLLPLESPLPSVAPADEGGVVFVWDHLPEPLLVLVEPRYMHFVVGAATDRAQYYDDVPFDGTFLPSDLLKALPRS